MFAAVAPSYDRLNHLLSLQLDRLWRRRLARELRPTDRPVLDLCAGTGDQALALARCGADVVAADFCLPMVARARRKAPGVRGSGTLEPIAADALHLPFPDALFGAVTVSFGIRNVADLDRSIGEMHRVLAPDGQLLMLEFGLPEHPVVRTLYLLYFRLVLPLVGRLFSRHRSAYRYLSDSVVEFPQRRALVERLEAAGFGDTTWTDLSLGTVCLYTARKR